MLKDLFKGDILLFLLRVFLLVVCLACSFDVFFCVCFGFCWIRLCGLFWFLLDSIMWFVL
jgi:hypothetical protein